MIHQPSGGAKGQATEIQIAAENILKTKKRLNEILAANTGKPYETIAADTERDNYMSAQEAADYGLIDGVIRIDSYVETSGHCRRYFSFIGVNKLWQERMMAKSAALLRKNTGSGRKNDFRSQMVHLSVMSV